MPKSYLVTAVEFSGDQRPTRTGVYPRRNGDGEIRWSHFGTHSKSWGLLEMSATMAYQWRGFESMRQRLKWYALPHQIPAGARIERVSGLTFRVTEA